MFKYTKYRLNQLETLFKELEYTIRYEKGNFKSGYALVEDKKIAVINKFFDTEARINSLLEILSGFEVDKEQLTEESAKFFKEFQRVIDHQK